MGFICLCLRIGGGLGRVVFLFSGLSGGVVKLSAYHGDVKFEAVTQVERNVKLWTIFTPKNVNSVQELLAKERICGHQVSQPVENEL